MRHRRVFLPLRILNYNINPEEDRVSFLLVLGGIIAGRNRDGWSNPYVMA